MLPFTAPRHWSVSGKLWTKGGPETFVELIRVKRLPDSSRSRL